MQISVTSPEIQTQLFIVILGVALFFSVSKRSQPAFDIRVTNELKGLAILMIMLAHIGYFLSTDHRFLFPLSIGGGIGVNLFFFLSGYGLSASSIKKSLSILDFYKKRLLKLFLPLWVILAIFLLSDYFLLNRSYQFSEIWHSFLGYFPIANLTDNINSPLWFITLITIYYLLFPIIFNKKYLYLTGIILIIISYFLLFNNFIHSFLTSSNIFKYDVLDLYRTHFIAFPLGMIAADLINNKTTLKKIGFFLRIYFNKHKRVLWIVTYLGLFLALFIAYHTAIYSGVGKGEFKEQFISLITSASIVYLFIFNKLRFGLFSIIGAYSFEIYLIHWPVLSRFDIFYKFFPAFIATGFYLVLFIFLGFVLSKIVNLISTKVLKIV